MILHVCTFDKFVPPLIDLINEEFNTENHKFWLTGTQKLKQYPIQKADNIFVCRPSVAGQLYAHLKLFVMFHRARKLILHGLFSPRVIILLALCPWLHKRCYWAIWGGDLYQYQNPRPRLRDRIMEGLRRLVIKRLGHLVTYMPRDVELARDWYNARGEYNECLMYLSNIVSPKILNSEEQSTETHSGLNILVGNSADPSNNHIDAFRLLRPYKDRNIRIFVPLSYGDQAHAKKVIEQGQEWFGDEKFFPMTSFMPVDQYIDFLGTVDIAVFNHNRQQAMGNTITLLGLGKTVYMARDVSQWQLFEKLKIRVFDVSNFDNSVLDPDEVLNNKTRVNDFFSRSTLISQYSKVFL